jgi:predicted transcriptional regulator
MTINPISIEKDTLAAKALRIMNEKKITKFVYITKKIKKKQLVLFIFITY